MPHSKGKKVKKDLVTGAIMKTGHALKLVEILKRQIKEANPALKANNMKKPLKKVKVEANALQKINEACFLLILHCLNMNAQSMTIRQEKVKIKKLQIGDWEVVVRRMPVGRMKFLKKLE